MCPNVTAIKLCKGNGIGGVDIDLAFEKLADSRLRRANLAHGFDDRTIRVAVRSMVRREFQSIRKDFGTEASDRLLLRQIQVNGLSINYTSEDGAVRNGKMLLHRYAENACYGHC
jgi:hypothetical protein